jgi:hypothetical protein
LYLKIVTLDLEGIKKYNTVFLKQRRLKVSLVELVIAATT